MKNKIIDLIITEIENNSLFKNVFIESLELYPDIKENEKLENKFYHCISILENYNCYINYSFLIFDINKLIVKRFNDILNKKNIIAALNILKIKEV